ncbi:response regulator [uncultured Adlercreutzia sp.]|nr:response regulator [uncultured Adlercreutzia sp.]
MSNAENRVSGLACEFFESEGYRVLATRDGIEALRLAEKGPISFC